MVDTFEYVFPAIRGIQAGREYYVTMCPLRLLPRIFVFNEADLGPELRAQRQLNKGRLPEIVSYIRDNPEDYVFSAITVSVDAEVRFTPSADTLPAANLGKLQIPMSARFIINDGQHRRAAIELALQERPELGEETISVVMFIDQGLTRCQQMFADLNRYAIRPSRSLGVLYDYRDDRADVARMVVLKLPLYKDLTELERSTLALRSRRLFTLSALYTATGALLSHTQLEEGQSRADLAIAFWSIVADQFAEWQKVHAGELSSGEVRQDYIHSHGVVLHALGRAGNALLQHHPKDWATRVRLLGNLDWKRTNAGLWEGRAMVGGRLSKSQQHVTLTTNAVKNALGLPLLPEEKRLETEFLGARNAIAA